MLSLKIAIRYLVSKKSHGVVNVISAISIAGVAVATAAIIVVLSVFNGFTNLAKSHFSIIDPDLMVSPVRSKMISGADSLAAVVAATDGVIAATPTLTERGLLVGNEAQLGVVFKGVAPDYTRVIDYDDAVQSGLRLNPSYMLEGDVAAQMAIGVAARLGLQPGSGRAELYVPRRIGRINPANPAGAFFSCNLVLEDILAVDQMEFDADHILIPIDVARDILMYDNAEASAIEIKTAPGQTKAVASRLESLLGDGYTVATREQQHQEAYNMIAIEKWVTFAMLIFILVIAAFNIVSTLSLMVIEKRDNMATLRFMGASRLQVRQIFMWMGAFITLAGGMAGLILGVGLSLAQQYGGFIHLAGDPSKLTVDIYPVHVEFTDILAVLAIIAVMSAVTSLITRIFTRKID